MAQLLFEAPFGTLTLTDSNSGLRSVAFGNTLSSDSMEARQESDVLHHTAAELRAYFAGKLTAFTVPLDFTGLPPFRSRVLLELGSVPFGETVSYQQLAVAAGSPQAYRAVGSACAHNPFPVVIPCHRVLQSSGALGGYSGGLEIKRFLLGFERQRGTSLELGVTGPR